MDPIVHGLISGFTASKKTGWNKKISPYLFWGIVPDFYGFIMYSAVILGSSYETWQKYFFDFYNPSHSLIIALGVILSACLIRQKIYWPMLMWPLHILTDVISHQIIRTPIIWPITTAGIPGLFEYSYIQALIWTYIIVVPIVVFIVLRKVVK